MVNGTHSLERLDFTQRATINTMALEATRGLITIEDAAMAQYSTGSSSVTIEPEQRATESVKLAYHRNRSDAFLKISEALEDFTTVASQKLQNFPVLGALGTTAQLVPRDDGNREVSRRRSAIGRAFARQAGIATVIIRKGCATSTEARAVMSVAQRLLRTPTPPGAGTLHPHRVGWGIELDKSMRDITPERDHDE